MDFTFSFNSSLLSTILNKNPNYLDWFRSLNTYLPVSNINTVNRVSAFLAQCCHESNNFITLEENLNYSATRLIEIFPTHFSNLQEANTYDRKPIKIANRVYANRMGNGDEKSGDGWNYRGRGLIQLTGKNSYLQYSTDVFNNNSAQLDPSLLTTTDGAVQSACWFWTKNNLNVLADQNNINAISRKINGGDNGLQERSQLYNKILSILKT